MCCKSSYCLKFKHELSHCHTSVHVHQSPIQPRHPLQRFWIIVCFINDNYLFITFDLFNLLQQLQNCSQFRKPGFGSSLFLESFKIKKLEAYIKVLVKIWRARDRSIFQFEGSDRIRYQKFSNLLWCVPFLNLERNKE